MSIWNLPELREDGNFPPAKDRSGEWLTTEANLQTLGDALQVPARKGGDHHQLVRAIPDPWAQARTFAEALIAGQDNHSLYNIALPQWRGLLALFALQGFHSKVYTLTPRQFTLGEGKTAKMFDRVLTHLHPQFAIGGDASLWTSPVLFMISGPKLKERPIAMGNPGCFVSPGRLTHKETIPNVAWYNEHGLRDPLACELPVTQLFVLKEWLEHLRASIDGQPGEVTPAIIARLNAYIADCEAETAELNLRANIGASLYDNLSPLYAPLFATAALLEPGDGAATSQTRLQLDPGCQLGALKGFILVDEALTRDPQFDRRKTMVWGNSTLGDLLVSEETRKNVADKAAEKGWAIITSDDLYTPRVVRFVADETKTSDSIDEKI